MQQQKPQLNHGEVIANTYINVLSELGLTKAEGVDIIGCSKATLDRKRAFSPSTKLGEMCLQIIRLYRSLYAICGGDRHAIRHLFTTKNHIIGLSPREAVHSIEGLIRCNWYYDALRGKT